MKSYRSPKLRLGKSKMNGTGVFAIDVIQKDEIVAVRGGEVVDFEESRRRDLAWGGFAMPITDHHYLCPRSAADIPELGVYLNHSCNPNIGILGQIVFVAMRKIVADEELAIDYAMNVAHPYHLLCTCGSALCRSVITGEDWKRNDLRARYQGYFCTYIQEKINRERPSPPEEMECKASSATPSKAG